MKTYRTVDRSGWGIGPWMDEPDKAQWVDPDTGLDCMVVRNGRMGNLCGYVGVGPDHPAFGKHYDSLADIDVHGGLTFADSCHEPTREEWDKVPDQLLGNKAMLKEAQQYPQGDSARRVAELRKEYEMEFPEWYEYQMARRICHIPEPGQPTEVWWFGFDCAHAWDLVPGMEAMMKKVNGGFSRPKNDIYRDFEYVQNEVRNLARQLAAMAPPVDHTATLDDIDI